MTGIGTATGGGGSSETLIASASFTGEAMGWDGMGWDHSGVLVGLSTILIAVT